jgi:hypothetical protein
VWGIVHGVSERDDRVGRIGLKQRSRARTSCAMYKTIIYITFNRGAPAPRPGALRSHSAPRPARFALDSARGASAMP